jgi:hypothetical protein
MSLIDKARSFMGGHGVTVRHVAIEGKAPAAASLALADGGVRGTFAVIADKPCTILARRTETVMELRHADGHTEQVVLGRELAPTPDDTRDARNARDAPVKYPYELAAGHEVEGAFDVIFDGSIEALLAQRRLVVGRDLRFFLRTLIDVKGSPFDPEAIDELPLRP